MCLESHRLIWCVTIIDQAAWNICKEVLCNLILTFRLLLFTDFNSGISLLVPKTLHGKESSLHQFPLLLCCS